MTEDQLRSHYSCIYRMLQRERGMRERVIKGVDERKKRVAEIDECIAALLAMKDELKRCIQEEYQLQQMVLINPPEPPKMLYS